MISIVALGDGRVVEQFALAHGEDPETELAARGWSGWPRAVARGDDDDLVIRYAVRPGPASAGAPREWAPREAGLSAADVAKAVAYQRVAAYALIRSERGTLLTELSESTNAAGKWNLPGGGVEPGEEPAAAVRREVHEETSQVVSEPVLRWVSTGHWIGRSPRGRVEDYHAVRLWFTAQCHTPSTPVILDVGGSTSDARWVREAEFTTLTLVNSASDAIAVIDSVACE